MLCLVGCFVDVDTWSRWKARVLDNWLSSLSLSSCCHYHFYNYIQLCMPPPQMHWINWKTCSGVQCDRRMPVKGQGLLSIFFFFPLPEVRCCPQLLHCLIGDFSTLLCLVFFFQSSSSPAFLKSLLTQSSHLSLPIMLYRAKTWATTKKQVKRIEVNEMRMFYDGCAEWHAKTRSGMNTSEEQWLVTHASKQVTDRRLNWYGHVMRRDGEHILRKVLRADRPGKRWPKTRRQRYSQLEKDWTESGRGDWQWMEKENHQSYLRP